MATGLSKKRIFIDPVEVIPGRYLGDSSNFVCPDSVANNYGAAESYHRINLNIYDYNPATSMDPMRIFMSQNNCFDCTSNGDSLQKSSYSQSL